MYFAGLRSSQWLPCAGCNLQLARIMAQENNLLKLGSIACVADARLEVTLADLGKGSKQYLTSGVTPSACQR